MRKVCPQCGAKNVYYEAIDFICEECGFYTEPVETQEPEEEEPSECA